MDSIYHEIDKKLASDDYDMKVEQGLHNLNVRADANPKRNEATSRTIFQQELYNLARNFFGVQPDMMEEEKIERHTFAGKKFKGKGSIDSMCNQLVIEYKRPSQLENDPQKATATNQLHEYLESLYHKDGSKYTGVLTDASILQFSYWEDTKLVTSDFGKITKNDFERIMLHLLGTETKTFNARNIIHDFRLGSESNISTNLARFLFTQLKDSKPSDQANMLWVEWMRHSHYSLEDNGKAADIQLRRKALGKAMSTTIKSPKTDYMALFALQTTYAIIVKLIACRVLTKIEHEGESLYFQDLINLNSESLKQRLEIMESGSAVSGIRNLLEGDFFSWYYTDSVWNEEAFDNIAPLIRELGLYTPDSYLWNSRTLDIFEELYMGMMPSAVRHSNGEYFTPSWLANQVIDRSIEVGGLVDDFTAIDPCCGTGVFLMQLIKKFIGGRDIGQMEIEDKVRLMEKILNGIYGIDINPLSVLAARVNFYLCTRELLDDYQGVIEIPIYIADSTYFAPTEDIGGTICYIYQMSTSKTGLEVALPACLVESDDFFTRIFNAQSSIVGRLGVESICGALIAGSKNQVSDEALDKITQLVNELIEFEENGLGTLWLRIIANYMRAASIKDRDLIVGNPPWVRWSNLQQMYNEKITKEINENLSHIFSGDAWMGGIQLNICALIANVTASSWLTESGTLAFLMPKSVAQHHSYNGFRNFFINEGTSERLYLQELDDWEKAGNPFKGADATEKFMTYFYNRTVVDYKDEGVPVNEMIKQKGQIQHYSGDLSFESVKHLFNIQTGKRAHTTRVSDTAFTYFSEGGNYTTADFSKIIGPSHYHWGRTGVEFTPSDIFLFTSIGKSRNNSRWKFKPTRGIKGIRNSDYGPVELERDLIKSVIRAPEVSPFRIKDERKEFGCVPFADGESIPYGQNELLNLAPLSYQYLILRRKIIESQSKASLGLRRGDAKFGGEHFYSLGKLGLYTTAPHVVVYRDNGNNAAAVMQERTMPWGVNARPITEKHAATIAQTNDCYFHETSGEMIRKKGELKHLSEDERTKYHQQEVRNITEDESYYICAILNSPIVNSYFQLSADPRGISKIKIVGSIRMPLFDAENQNHVNLMKIARKATEQGHATDEQLKSLDENYLALCYTLVSQAEEIYMIKPKKNNAFNTIFLLGGLFFPLLNYIV